MLDVIGGVVSGYCYCCCCCGDICCNFGWLYLGGG